MVDDPIWTPVAVSRALRRGGVSATVVDGKELAIWRSNSGAVRAWDNRCPHRGMRLSHGFVRGERLACLYHGWHYDGAGKCDYIPAHPELEPPASIKAVVHACVETGAFVWVGSEEAGEPPHVAGFDAGIRSLHLAVPTGPLSEALKGGLLGTAEEIEPGMLRLQGDPLPAPLLVAVQLYDAGSVLHLAGPSDADADTLCVLSDLAEDFRRRIERERAVA